LKEIEIRGTKLILGYDKFILLPELNILVVSDLHLGKLTHFRKHGISLPSFAQMKDLERLKTIMDSCVPDHCIFLGDLFHSDLNSFWMEFLNFIELYPALSFTLIKGNHDIIDEALYKRAGIKVLDRLIINDLIFTHEQVAGTPYFNIYGHIHPGIMISGKARQKIKLPCFYFTASEGIMPAFGTFTGLYTMQRQPDHKVYVSVGKEVIEL